MAGQAPPGYAKKVLHAGLTLGDGVLEGCDASPGEYKKPQSFCVMFRPKDAAEADRIFGALAEDGAVQIPIAETFWALRFGMVVDRFEMPWLIMTITWPSGTSGGPSMARATAPTSITAARTAQIRWAIT